MFLDFYIIKFTSVSLGIIMFLYNENASEIYYFQFKFPSLYTLLSLNFLINTTLIFSTYFIGFGGGVNFILHIKNL